MSKQLPFALSLILLIMWIPNFSAQINIPRPSPTATITQAVGLTEFVINYSRPGVKGRAVFGALVPYDKIWRTGANGATTIKFEHDVKLNGNEVAAGEYALYSIPGKEVWTLMLYKDLKLGGAVEAYKQDQESMRFTATPRALEDQVESFTIDWSHFKSEGATLTLSWENTAVDIAVEVPTDALVMAAIKDQLLEPKGPDASTYAAAATYYIDNDMDKAQALEWMNQAVALRPEAFWYEYRQAKLLMELGRIEEAIAAAESSLAKAKANEGGDYGYVQSNEALLLELKK